MRGEREGREREAERGGKSERGERERQGGGMIDWSLLAFPAICNTHLIYINHNTYSFNIRLNGSIFSYHFISASKALYIFTPS